MFKNKDAAAQVNEDLLAINTLLNYSLQRVQSKCSPAEFKVYRKIVGQIMGLTTIDALPALWKMHPQLKPQGFKDVESWQPAHAGVSRREADQESVPSHQVKSSEKQRAKENIIPVDPAPKFYLYKEKSTKLR